MSKSCASLLFKKPLVCQTCNLSGDRMTLTFVAPPKSFRDQFDGTPRCQATYPSNNAKQTAAKQTTCFFIEEFIAASSIEPDRSPQTTLICTASTICSPAEIELIITTVFPSRNRLCPTNVFSANSIVFSGLL